MFRRFYQHLRITIAGTLELWWLPVLMGLATAATVWVVWYYTEIPCTPANAIDYQCNPSAIARYIDAEILSRCITLGAIVATLVGGLNIYMFIKEREARVAAENRLAEERHTKDELLEEWRAERQQWQEQLTEERRRADEQLTEERRRADEQLTEERRRADEQLTEERRRADEQLAEERRRADENQRALLATIAELVAHENGNGSSNKP